MTIDTLYAYDRLVDAGFSDEQARAVVGLLASSRETHPEITRALEQILRRLDEQGAQLDKLSSRHHRLRQLNPQRF